MNEEIIDTSGFYRINPNIINELEYAPNFVHGPGYSINRDGKDTYTYPTDGEWYWFNISDEAHAFFNIPIPVNEPEVLSEIPPYIR
jgi:hypothetical protein